MIADLPPPAHVIVAPRGDYVVRGSPRADTIIAPTGRHLIRAGAGGDLILAGRPGRHGPAVRVRAGRGPDEVVSQGGHDRLDGGRGHDRLFGGWGHDRLDGGRGADDLHGGGGHDRLDGGSGHDHATGSAGPDVVHGGLDADALTGGPGADHVYGDAGDDNLHLWRGNDYGYGGAGYDRIGGYTGNDSLIGGPGVDAGWDLYGKNHLDVELRQRAYPPGHPNYKPTDDRIGGRPKLRGGRCHRLRRAIVRLRGIEHLTTEQQRDEILSRRGWLARGCLKNIRHHYNGVRRVYVAIWKMGRLTQGYSAELDRLTVDYERRHPPGP